MEVVIHTFGKALCYKKKKMLRVMWRKWRIRLYSFFFLKFLSYAQRYNNPVFLLILFGDYKQTQNNKYQAEGW